LQNKASVHQVGHCLSSFWMFSGTEFISKCRRFWDVRPCRSFER